MKKRLLAAVLACTAVGLILVTPQATASHRDPDTTVDPASLTDLIIQLLAPDVTIGDTDTTIAGIGTDVVGVDDSLTDPPPDPADADPGTTYFVDNTPSDGDCPPTPYTTIQAGVNASGPGDTVKVCPGTYPEQVRIVGHNHDGLKLESLRPLQAIIQWPTVESFPLALVDFNTADHVTLRGFTATGPFTFPACSPDRHEGLLVENGLDEHIHHNHITNIRNSLASLRGCQEGDAVAIGRRTDPALGFPPGSARVDHNVIDTYQKNGVQAVNSGTVADVDHNVITGPGFPSQPYAAPNGVVVFRQAAATIDHNIVSGNHFTGSLAVAASGGVLIFDTPTGSSSVGYNRIFDNDYGIDTEAQANLEISHNDVFQHVLDGIVLCGDTTQGCLGAVSGIIVRKNDITNNGGNGILLLGAVNNLLKSNHIENNGTPVGDTTDGIRVALNSMGNQIADNHMNNNVHHDCHDDSTGTGSGTPPTANTWTNDEGQTQNRNGLCRFATTTT
jgi:parallel beta-helix repeat protein